MSQPIQLSKQCDMDMQSVIGGAYIMSDGRTFWIDHAVVREIMSRVRPIVSAEAERQFLAGTREPNLTNVGGGA